MPNCRCANRNISELGGDGGGGGGAGGFVELGHFNKHFKNMSKTQRGPTGKHFTHFSPRYS